MSQALYSVRLGENDWLSEKCRRKAPRLVIKDYLPDRYGQEIVILRLLKV